jgi:hypothetical protein
VRVDVDEKATCRFPPVKFRFDGWGAGARRYDGSLEPRDPKYKPPPLSVMAI